MLRGRLLQPWLTSPPLLITWLTCEGLLAWLMIQLEAVQHSPEEVAGIVDIFEKVVLRLCQREENSEKPVTQGHRRWLNLIELLAATAAEQASECGRADSVQASALLNGPIAALGLTSTTAFGERACSD